MAEPKKQVPLRLNAKLYDALAAWAEDDFRSVNGQIEYLLTECVRQRKKNGKYISDQLDVPPELDLYRSTRDKRKLLKQAAAQDRCSGLLFVMRKLRFPRSREDKRREN